MKKQKSSAFWWLICPTYKLAERKKFSVVNKGQNKDRLTQILKSLNRTYFILSLVIATTVGLSIPLIECKLGSGLYTQTGFIKWVFIGFVCFLSWIFLISRGIEITKAFLDDAVQKFNKEESSSSLKFGERLILSFKSYLELIVNFGTLYYLLPTSFFDKGEFSSIIEAIYFSGVTITTLGYGDFSPSHPFVQILTVFEVLAGFSLIVVSFAVYSSLAINGEEKT
ncbi:potassium channel family protein [uncultured Desulfobacter sp.]|uniref:potassium channel family protein n=1 Tax=uncultured Desulfobacter sp. TaxID=240139 RepID=UPI0029F53E84|nr:potassium channel family protein [uncultured Desulfobacter sp.]